MTPLAAYLLLFVAVGVGFIFVHLVAGKLIRPSKPDAEKGTIYECGEPTIGSAWIQFDLRFYVVALLFVIFDVEVAFFFPWAEVFGKANAVANTPKPETAQDYREYAAKVLDLARPTAARSSPSDVQPGKTSKAGYSRAFLDRREYSLRPSFRYRNMLTMTDEQLEKMQAEQKQVKEKKGNKTPEADEGRIDRFDGPLEEGEFDKNQTAARNLSLFAFLEVAVFFGVLLVGFAYLWRRGDLAWVRSTAAERPQQGEMPPPAPGPAPVITAARETVGVGGHS